MDIVQAVKQCEKLMSLESNLNGICYQAFKETDEIETEESSEIHLNLNQAPNQLQHQSTAPQSKKRKLSKLSKVTPSPDDLNLLEKKKLSFKFSFSINKVCPSVSYLKYSNIDTLWMIAANLFSKTPMWAGWNTQQYPEPISKQVVCYMQNIRLPPTREITGSCKGMG